MRLNESETSYLHKNADSTTIVLSGEKGWVSSMVPQERRKSCDHQCHIGELCLEIPVMSFNLASVLDSKTRS